MIFQSYSSSFSSLLPSWEACKDAICLRNTRINIYALNILAISLVVGVSTAVIDLKSPFVLGGGIITLALTLFLKTKCSKNTEVGRKIQREHSNTDSSVKIEPIKIDKIEGDSPKAIFINKYIDTENSIKTEIANKNPEKIGVVLSLLNELIQKHESVKDPHKFLDLIPAKFELLQANSEAISLKNSQEEKNSLIIKFFTQAKQLLAVIEESVLELNNLSSIIDNEVSQ